ncbi:hypothetical protein FTO70_03055 [Methanosarcina sp. KYL-1]|uniref:COG1470 family protein n=1 Tax=Methanosarcina sp. KYL-1 TaxID=2602068 RepID=UPI0021014D87|nr:DUF916 domain-containing protein [Methanosarcina sp. KYL-1]MCQ1534685.1 hypothetical protein [Methanosarcina sp. KYL-1]
MKTLNTKTLRNIVCGILALSLLSLACTGAMAGNEAGSEEVNEAVPVRAGAVQSKTVTSIAPMPELYAGDYFPEFEKLRIDPPYQYLEMEPGSEESFTVTVENKDNKTITLTPEPLIVPYTENFIDKNWISISPAEKVLEPGQEAEFEVKVEVPEDADLGNYAVLLAFTGSVPEGDVAGYYPNYPGTMQLNLQVWVPPKVQVLTPWISDLVEAEEAYEYEVLLRNTGSEDISIKPELGEGGDIIYYKVMPPYGGPEQAFGNDAISINAPEKIKAGQTATVKLLLKVPAGAKGSYSGTLDLNIDDPGIREYEGRVSLNFRILPTPEKPYETSFEARTDGPITIELSTYQYGYGLYAGGKSRDLTPTFEVSLKDPSGNAVVPVLESTKYTGSVSVMDETYPQPYPLPYMSSMRIADGMENAGQGSYQGGNTGIVETYTLPGAAGKWTLSILPKNTENFDYSITIGPVEE